MAAGDGFSLEEFYDAYPRVEAAFQEALDESLRPRGPEELYDVVSGLGLQPGADVVDVGCGEGGHTVELARRFGFMVLGVDPVERHLELAADALAAASVTDHALPARVRFETGAAEALPMADATCDLVWCREVLVHVRALDRAFAEFRRVLRPGGRMFLYQMFSTDRLEPAEADWLRRASGIIPDSAETARVEAAMAEAGLRIDECVVVAVSGANGPRRMAEEALGGCSTRPAAAIAGPVHRAVRQGRLRHHARRLPLARLPHDRKAERPHLPAGSRRRIDVTIGHGHGTGMLTLWSGRSWRASSRPSVSRCSIRSRAPRCRWS